MKNKAFSETWKKIFKEKIKAIPSATDPASFEHKPPESFYQEIVQDAKSWEEICEKWVRANLEKIFELEKNLTVFFQEYQTLQKQFAKKISKKEHAAWTGSPEDPHTPEALKTRMGELRQTMAHIKSVMDLFLECQGEDVEKLQTVQKDLEARLVEKEETVSGYGNEVEELKRHFDEEYARMQETLKEASDELAAVKKSRDEWVQNSEAQTVRLRKYEEEVLEQSVAIENLTAAQTVLEKTCVELTKNRDEFETGKPQLEGQLRDFSGKNQALEAEIQRLRHELTETLKTRDEWAAKHQAQLTVLEKHQTDLAELGRKVQQLEAAKFTLETTHTTLTQKHHALEIAKAEIEKELRAKGFETQKTHEMLAAAQKSLDELTPKIREQAAFIKKHENHLTELENENKALKTAQAEFETARAEMVKKCEEQESLKAYLEKQLQMRMEQNTLLEQEAAKAQEALSHAEGSRDEWMAKHQTQTDALKKQEDRIQELEKENKSLETIKGDLEKTQTELTQKCKELETFKSSLEKEIQVRSEQNFHWEQEVTKACESLALAQKNRDEWLAKIKEQAESLRKFENHMLELQTENESLREAAGQFEKLRAGVQEKHEELEALKTRFEQEIKIRVNQNTHLEQEIAKAREVLAVAEKTRDEWFARSREQTETIKKYESDISGLHAKVQDLEIAKVKSDNLRTEITRKHQELESLKTALEIELEARAQKNSALEQEVAKIQEALSLAQKSRDEWVVKYEEQAVMFQQFEGLKGKYQELKAASESVEKTLREAQRENAALQALSQQAQAGYETEIEKQQELCRLADAKSRAVAAELEKLEKEKKTFEEKYQALEKQFEKGKADFNEVLVKETHARESLEKEKRAVEEKYKTLEKQFEKEKAELGEALVKATQAKESLEQELQKSRTEPPAAPSGDVQGETGAYKELQEKHTKMEQELLAGREMFRKRLCSLFEEVEFWKKKALFGKKTAPEVLRDHPPQKETVITLEDVPAPARAKDASQAQSNGPAAKKADSGEDIISSLQYLERLVEKKEKPEDKA